jgi:5,10-methylenetetrahydromethanopterin reductase
MIRSGINVFLDVPVGQIVEVAQQAEQLGFSKCWVYDEGLATRDPYINLAAIALQTKNLRLGTGITNPYTRHPAVTAASIATLHELSGGRAFLGVGPGGALTLDPLGIELKKPLTVLRELVETTRGLFNGEAVTYQGQMLRLASAKIDYAQPGMEIWLAGRGPKILSLGGEVADGVVLDFLYKESIPEWLSYVHAGAALSGNKPKICYSTVIVTSEKTLEEVRPHMTYRLVNTPPEVKERIGLSEKEADAIRQAMSLGLEEAGKLVKDEWVRPFAIMGSIEECAQELKDLMTRYQLDEFLVPVLNTAEAGRLMDEVSQVLART